MLFVAISPSQQVAPDLPPRSPHLMTRIVNRPSASRRNGKHSLTVCLGGGGGVVSLDQD